MDSLQNHQTTATNESETFFISSLSSALGEAAIAASLHQVELMGSRWILALPELGPETLKHAKEEVIHACLMHREMTRLRNLLTDGESFAMNAVSETVFEATESYLNTILKICRKKILENKVIPSADKRTATYFLLSLLIERRLMKTYPHIVKHGRDPQLKANARKLIADEREHLMMIMEGVEKHVTCFGVDINSALHSESQSYALYMNQVSNALQCALAGQT